MYFGPEKEPLLRPSSRGWGSARARTWRQACEIYMIWLRPDGRLVPINRRYVGMGIGPENLGDSVPWCDWERLDSFALKELLTPALAQWIVGDHSISEFKDGKTHLYFYGDGCQPDLSAQWRREYDARIARLKSLVADPAEFERAMRPQACFSRGKLVRPAGYGVAPDAFGEVEAAE